MPLHEWAEKIKKWLVGWKLDPTVVSTLFVLLLAMVALINDPRAVYGAVAAAIVLSPIWLPVFLAVTFWKMWMHYIRFLHWFKLTPVVLEVTLPAEVTKSPLAMELALTSLWNTVGESIFIARIWKGSFRPIFSLEIASNEGRIGFYIHTDRQWRNTVESRIYGQYPECRITEVPDYVTEVPFNFDEYTIVGTEYMKNPAHSQATPIKTYVDYALDKDTDVPETTVEPLSHLLELFSSIGKDQYMWLQIIARGRKKDEWYGFYKDGWFKYDSWLEPAKEEIKTIMAGAAKRAQAVLKESEVVEGKMNALLTDNEKEHIEKIEHSMGKLVFECGIRSVYIAKKDNVIGPNIVGLVRLFDPYRTVDLNALNINNNYGSFNLDFPWQDWGGIRRRKVQENLWFQYKNRAYFYVPYDQVPVMLTTEELASLWHFPDSSIKTPGVQRVESKRAEAPSGLPI